MEPPEDPGRFNVVTRAWLPSSVVRTAKAHAVLSLAFWTVASAAMIALMPRLEIETTTGSVLDRSSAAWVDYQQAIEDFGGDEIIVVALTGEEPLSPSVVRRIQLMSREFAALEGVRRVDSVATVPLIRQGVGGAVYLDPLLRDGQLPHRRSVSSVVAEYSSDDLARGNLISDDGRTLAVNVVLDEKASGAYATIIERIQAIAGPDSLISGVPIFRYLANQKTRDELVWFGPVAVAVVGAGALAIFGSLRAMFAVLVPGMLALIVVFGVMAGIGMRVTISTVILPPVLLAIGCAYSIHLVSGVRKEGIEDAAVEVSPGVALSALTTSIGFLGVATVDIEAIRQLGILGAVGALVAGFATLTVVPILVDRAAVKKVKPWFADGDPRRSGSLVVVICAVVVGLSVVGMARLNVATDVIEWFPETHKARKDYEEIRERLSGISPMNFVVSMSDGRVLDRRVLQAIRKLELAVEEFESVGHVTSVLDPMLKLHEQMDDRPRDGDVEVPARDLVEQYMEVLEAEGGMSDLITRDRSGANLVLRVNENDSETLLDVAERVEREWGLLGVEDARGYVTGIMYEFARAEEAIAMGQMRALIVAAAVIGVILLLVARDIRVGLAVLAVNLLPVMVVFGAMGGLGIPLDAGTVLVGNLALGIGVDDSIHVVWAVQRRRMAGVEWGRAVNEGVEKVARPVVTTTVVLCCGFMVLGFSGFSFTRNLGVLTVGVLSVCCVADLWVLPAILRRLSPRGSRI